MTRHDQKIVKLYVIIIITVGIIIIIIIILGLRPFG